MPLPRPKELTATGTYMELGSQEKFNLFLQELQDYLKTKLQLITVNGIQQYSCGQYHYKSNHHWIPFQHLDTFCLQRGHNFYTLRFNIEKYFGRKIKCECEIVNDSEQMRRDRLKRMFGIEVDGRAAGFVEVDDGKVEVF